MSGLQLMIRKPCLPRCGGNFGQHARYRVQRAYSSQSPSPVHPTIVAKCWPAHPKWCNPRVSPGPGLQGNQVPASLLQWRSSAANGNSRGVGETDGSAGKVVLEEGTPGVDRQEGEARPAAVLPDAAPESETADGELDTDASEQRRNLQTYTEAITDWFVSKREELQQLLSGPAVTVFGREIDLSKLNNLTDKIDLRKRVDGFLNLGTLPSNGEGDTLEATQPAASTSASTLGDTTSSIEENTGLAREHPAAAALREGGHAQLSFGFSAGGLLFPYYIGVVERLTELGIMTGETKVGGASAGSLIAAVYHSGLPIQTVIDACFVLCEDCRIGGTRGRLRSVLQTFLEELLPSDIAERCNGKVHVAVTTLFPRPRGVIVSEFASKEDLIAALLTSCHIPWWFDGSVWTSFRGRASYDGGLTNFIPRPAAQHGVRVCCFPAKQMKSVYDIEISPDSFESWQHPMKQMVSWAFEPAEEDILRLYIEKGRADAQAWAEATGVLKVIEERNAKDGSSEKLNPGSGTVEEQMAPAA